MDGLSALPEEMSCKEKFGLNGLMFSSDFSKYFEVSFSITSDRAQFSRIRGQLTSYAFLIFLFSFVSRVPSTMPDTVFPRISNG